MIEKLLPWHAPLSYAQGIREEEPCWALLYSGMDVGFSGRYSILALHKHEEIKEDSFETLSKKLSKDQSTFDNSWFGYIGYGLKNTLEELPFDQPSIINLPDLWVVQYRLVIMFDHQEQKIIAYGKSEKDFDFIPIPVTPISSQAKVTTLTSPIARGEYLTKVAQIKEDILSGNLYQANLTRKFYGKVEGDAFGLFVALCKRSPAPYSAFLKYGDVSIVSSSPERFITCDKNGLMDTRPIKGSAARYDDEVTDKESRKKLQQSTKDRAENLMIVDLMRNDFSRSCEVGSVVTPSLFDITSYATVHHMASTVQGKKRRDVSTLEAVKGCFPPGSMTGAPKIKAMELCSQLEELARGVYSGAIGWFGGDGSSDLSVVIRTIILQGKSFEFQVGGAIVADSIPEQEWEETLIKARAIADVMGISRKELESL